MTFGDKLKRIRLAKGMSQEEFASFLNTSKQVISRYENNQRTPKVTTASEYAEKLGIPVAQLLDNKIPYPDDEKIDVFQYDNIIPIKKRRVPLLGTIAAGLPIYASEEHESYVELGTDVRCDFALKVKGDSMIGARINDGDIVFVREQPTVENGEIAVVLIDDEATLKRVYFGKNAVTLVAENPQYDPITIIESDCKEVRILGKAVAFQSDVR